MANIKTVGIKDLKNNLSEYVRFVKSGVRVLITDRQEVVAEMVEPGSNVSAHQNPIINEWLRAGKIHMPTKKISPLPLSSLKLKPGTAQRLIDEDRGE